MRLWSASGANIEPGAVFDIGGLGSFNPRVRSVCWSADGAKLLIGTMGSELYEISAGDGSNYHAGPVLQGHCRHEVHGLAMSPVKPEYATVGDDQTVRVWDLKTRALIKMVMLDTMARCCRYSPDGTVIVVGLGAKVEGVARQKKMGAYIVLVRYLLRVLFVVLSAHFQVSSSQVLQSLSLSHTNAHAHLHIVFTHLIL